MLEIIAIGVLILVILFAALMYNNLVSLRARVDNAWAQIDVYLTKRYELVPNLVETVKAYAKHEKTVFENVTKARSMWANAQGVAQKAKANETFAGALKSLLAVAEDYPKLQANENFKLLQEQLDGIESKVAYTRQAYNDSAMEYNAKIQQLPEVLVAGLLGFGAREFFEAESEAKKAVKVRF